MKAIIIAAGPSKRLRPLTENLPKCMLKINGKPIIQNTIELFRNNNVGDISIIRGWKKEKIDFSNVNYFENKDFWNNNILHSLMHARAKLEEAIKTNEEVIMSYSDIWYDDKILKTLLSQKHDIAAVVDIDWLGYYEGRTEHPISEAEKVSWDEHGNITKTGKQIFNDKVTEGRHGEFVGLWKFTPKGTKIFLKHFDRLNRTLKMTDPYQNAREWQKSYITDIFQEMVDKGEKIYCAFIEKGWKEFDTVQDFLRIGGEMPED